MIVNTACEYDFPTELNWTQNIQYENECSPCLKYGKTVINFWQNSGGNWKKVNYLFQEKSVGAYEVDQGALGFCGASSGIIWFGRGSAVPHLERGLREFWIVYCVGDWEYRIQQRSECLSSFSPTPWHVHQFNCTW